MPHRPPDLCTMSVHLPASLESSAQSASCLQKQYCLARTTILLLCLRVVFQGPGSPPFSPGDWWETGRPPSVFGQLGDWLPAGFVEVGDSIMLHDRVSCSFPVPQCQCACHRAYGFVCNSACVFTVCMVRRRQALKRAIHDQNLSHLHPDLLVSHLGLRSWETWAVCLPLPWCAKRGPGPWPLLLRGNANSGG